MVIADKFGTSSEYDLYLIATILPALAYGVINFSSFYLFVPYLTRMFERAEGRSGTGQWRPAWSLLNSAMICAIAVTAAVFLSAPYLMKIWGSGYTENEFARIIFYSRFTALIIILGTSEAFLRAVLNARKIFTYPAAGPIIFNIVSVTAIMVFHERFSVGAVAVGLVGGLLLQNIYLVLRLLSIGRFSDYRPSFLNKDAGHLIATAGVLLLIEFMNRSYFMIDRYFAPAFGEGVISALNYSQVLVLLPDAVVGFAIASVVFPLFSRSQSGQHPDRFVSTYQKAITGGVLIAAPLAVFFFTNASDIVYLVFYRGVFDATSLEITTRILEPYTPTIIALFVVSTSIRACYGRGWNKAVLAFTALLLVSKFAATALLPKWLGYPGISAATSLSHVAFAVALLCLIVRRSQMKEGRRFLFSLAKLLLSAALCFLAYSFIKPMVADLLPELSRLSALARLVISAAILFGLYTAVVYFAGFGDYLKAIVRGRPNDT
jgi:putative peptidoglycan lipid II flippase